MFKKVYLVGSILFILIFGLTIRTTISNPNGTNLLISGTFLVIAIVSFILNIKVNKEETKDEVDGFTPVIE